VPPSHQILATPLSTPMLYT